jgi:hypothetical protein
MEEMARPDTIDFDKPFVYASVNDTAVRAETFAEAKRFFNIPGRIHLVLMMDGDDAPSMLPDFEETLYPYGSERNRHFHCRVFGWQELGWAIVSVPARDEERVQNFLATYKRQLAKNMQFTVLSNTGAEPFPFTGEQFRLVRKEEGMLLSLIKK